MRGTPLGRPRLALRRVRRTRVLGLALGLLALGLMSAGIAHAEDVVIPYECDVRMGDVRLVPSEPRPYRIYGARDRQIYSACDPQDPGQCKNYQIHRFDIDCGGTRVSWLKVAEAAARIDGERVSVKRNQMLLEVEPRGGQADEPYPADGRWDPDRRGGSDPYGNTQGEAVVSFPPGFAPAIGMKPIFTGRDPAQVQQLPPAGGSAGATSSGYGVPYDAAENGGWNTEAKGWSQSPKGVPLDQEAQTGWDADKVIASGPEGSSKPAPVSKSAAAAAGSKTPGASYGTETVTSQQLPEIGARPSKPADTAKKTAAASSDPAKAAQKKPAVKPAETAVKAEPAKQSVAKAEAPKAEPKAELPKSEAAKAEPSKTEVAKSEPPKSESARAEVKSPGAEAASAPQPAPTKTEVSGPQPSKPEPSKTDTAMIAPPQTVAAPEAPQMLNGREAIPPSAAPKPDVAAAPPMLEPAAPLPAAQPQPTQSTSPPELAASQPSTDVAQGPAQPASTPEATTVVAEAAPKPQDATAIETSSISIVGQKVPVPSFWYLGAAALLTAAGFFFMMRRGQEVEADAYVERDITRVSLGGAGEAGARLAGPSFELPMPEFTPSADLGPQVVSHEARVAETPYVATRDAAALVPQPSLEMMPLEMPPRAMPVVPPLAVMPPVAEVFAEPRPQISVPDMSLMSDIRSRMAPPVDEITVQVPYEVATADEAMAASPELMMSEAEAAMSDGEMAAPEAVELARALAEGSDVGEPLDETHKS